MCRAEQTKSDGQWRVDEINNEFEVERTIIFGCDEPTAKLIAAAPEMRLVIRAAQDVVDDDCDSVIHPVCWARLKNSLSAVPTEQKVWPRPPAPIVTSR